MSYEGLVAQFLAKGGKITKVPTGETKQTTYIWDAKKNDLVPLENGLGNWRQQMNAEARSRHEANRRKARLLRPDVIAANARRSEIQASAPTTTVADMARRFSVDEAVIRNDLSVLGITALNIKDVRERRAKERLELVASYVKRFPISTASGIQRAMAEDGYPLGFKQVSATIRAIKSGDDK